MANARADLHNIKASGEPAPDMWARRAMASLLIEFDGGRGAVNI